MSCKCEAIPTATWADFTTYTGLFLDKAPGDVMEFFVRAAAIEWASETLMLQRDIYVDVQECVRDYQLLAPDGYVIRSIREVYYGDMQLHPVQRMHAHDVRTRQYYFDNIDQIVIGESPDEDTPEKLLVRTIVSPSQDSCGIDRWVYERYAEHIATGALSKAYLMKDASWANPRDGGIMLRRWRAFLGRAKIDKAKGGNTGPVFLKVPRFI